jgi:deoxyribose-phosphate aldolase
MIPAHCIDHTKLHPNITQAEVAQLCAEAAQHQFAAVCIPPYFVADCAKFLINTAVKTCTVVGFPMGYSTIAAKVEEIKKALDDGAQEIDAVINIAALLQADWRYINREIESMTNTCHFQSKVIKIILETAYLQPEHYAKITEMCANAGVDFVKTSTGYAPTGARVDDIAQLRLLLPDAVKIKASGGIKTIEDAKKMLTAGAQRIGTSAGLKLIIPTAEVV